MAPSTPVTMVDCYLRADSGLPSAGATPGFTGRAGAFTSVWRGEMTLRNETGAAVNFKTLTVHVLDGYGKPLFDLPPMTVAPLAAHQTVKVPLQANYQGAVTVFQFSADGMVSSPDGKDQPLHLGAASGNSPKLPTRLPGY